MIGHQIGLLHLFRCCLVREIDGFGDGIIRIFLKGRLYFYMPFRTDVVRGDKEGLDLIRDVRDILNGLNEFDHNNIEASIRAYVEEKAIGFGLVMNPLRLALIGSNQGPGLTVVMEILGRKEVLLRVVSCLEKFKKS